MSTARPGTQESWRTLARHDWDGELDLLSRLSDTLRGLDGVDDRLVLHDEVDVEPIVDAVAPDARGRQASEVRFTHGTYEIRIDDDGRIAARRE